MDKKQMTLVALLAFAAGGGTVLVVDDKGKSEKVEVVAETKPEAVELVGRLGNELGGKMVDAESSGPYVCERGKLNNKPDAVFCDDGRGRGFMLSKDQGDAVVDPEDVKPVVLSESGGRVMAGVVDAGAIP